MPCLAIHRWTFSGLVGAFLDLSITFLLLCASALAYFASKFLSFFGLYLPCPCSGFFAIPDANNNCLQRQFLDYPLKNISSVQSSVKTKFPFDLIGNNSQWQSNNNLEDYTKLVKNIDVTGSEGESSCISSTDKRTTENSTDGDLAKMKEKSFVMGAMSLEDEKERKSETKWKGLPRHRSRKTLRRRRKGAADHNRKLSQIPSFKSSWSNVESPQSAPPAIITDDTSKAEDNPDRITDGKEGLMVDIGSKRKISQGYELYESVDENEVTDHENISELDGNSRNTIRLLEQALEEEHAARAFLYVELEKERGAAATAADEAMAMILRLQKEKAAIEMEARQSQRMIEEKYAYDTEEMNILKEILLRREREKYFLEKEVEAYRQTICGSSGQFDADNTFGCWYSTNDDDSMQMMPQNHTAETTVALPLPLAITKFSEEENSPTINDITGHSGLSDEGSMQQKTCATLKLIESSTTLAPNLPQKPGDKDFESTVHDVHVIDDQSSMSEQTTGNKTRQLSSNSATSNNNLTKSTSSCSIIHSGLPPIGGSKTKLNRTEMRRKSMSAFDVERYKIDSEISWLRERLKNVQEGREKLKFSTGNRERENIQLQILEDIASHLREIRQLTEPGKVARRASLPPLTSNVMLKKRRWRSGQLLIERST